MTENDDQVERMLRRYRPAGPSPQLRVRVLAPSRLRAFVPWRLCARPSWLRRFVAPSLGFRSAAAPRPAPLWPLWAYRGAVAAMLALALCLNWAANSIAASTAARIGVGPAQWTPEAERIAAQIGGEAGRQYIALCLMGSSGRS